LGRKSKPELYGNPLIECACGCGEKLRKYKLIKATSKSHSHWKERRYIFGHQNIGRKRPDMKRFNELQKGKHWSPKTEFKKGLIPWNKGLSWSDEILKKIFTRRSPNNEEKFLIDFFIENNLPYKYVGDGEFIIGGRNPDFINTNGKKQIIEFFGEYWHRLKDEDIKRKIYQNYGFDLLIIWGKELRDEKKLLEKISTFERS